MLRAMIGPGGDEPGPMVVNVAKIAREANTVDNTVVVGRGSQATLYLNTPRRVVRARAGGGRLKDGPRLGNGRRRRGVSLRAFRASLRAAPA